MNCRAIREKLASVTADAPVPAFDAAELGHIARCAACRELAAEWAGMGERIASAAAGRAPAPEYWASVVPRLRRRIDAGPRWPGAVMAPAIRSALMPAAAAIVLAILLPLAAVRGPGSGAELLGSLSDAELRDLRLDGSYAELLDQAGNGAGSHGTLSDFLTDLISEEGIASVSGLVDPVDLLPDVDEARFTEIVGVLERQ